MELRKSNIPGLIIVVGLLSLFFPASCWADTVAAPFSYSSASANGQYVFIMLAPVTLDSDATGQRKEIRGEALRIWAKY